MNCVCLEYGFANNKKSCLYGFCSYCTRKLLAISNVSRGSLSAFKLCLIAYAFGFWVCFFVLDGLLDLINVNKFEFVYLLLHHNFL